MKAILSERNIVVVLFVMVLITFSLAHEDSKKLEKVYTGANTTASAILATKLKSADIMSPELQLPH